jgi:hypothetical protein
MPDLNTKPPRGLLQQQALDYRRRAEQFRTVMETARSPEVRRILHELADSADKMAATIERQLHGLKAAC